MPSHVRGGPFSRPTTGTKRCSCGKAPATQGKPLTCSSRIWLPDIDGPSLARSLRERDPQLFVIALTGHPDRDAGWTGTLLDRAAFFQKPIMAADLLSARDALTARDARGGEECPLEPGAGAGAERR